MKESIKNFAAMVIATITYFLGLTILFAIYWLLTSQPDWLEIGVVAGIIALFCICLIVAKFNERVRTAMEYPFI